MKTEKLKWSIVSLMVSSLWCEYCNQKLPLEQLTVMAKVRAASCFLPPASHTRVVVSAGCNCRHTSQAHLARMHLCYDTVAWGHLLGGLENCMLVWLVCEHDWGGQKTEWRNVWMCNQYLRMHIPKIVKKHFYIKLCKVIICECNVH